MNMPGTFPFDIKCLMISLAFHTPWKFHSSPLKISHQERKVIFQPSLFRGALLNFGCVSSLVNLNLDLIICHFTNCHCKLNFNKVDSIIMN